MDFAKKYFLVISIFYWLLVMMFAIEPGRAVLDKYFFTLFAVGLLIWLLIVFYLKVERIKILISAILVIFLLPLFFVISLGTAYKPIKIDEPNPFAYLDGESGTAFYTVSFLDWPFWFPNKLEQRHLNNMQPSRLIKFSQNEQYLHIRGASETIVIEAFGEPTREYTEDERVVWEYHPWQEHPDWIMPVYLKDGLLWSVGSPSAL